MNSPFAVFAAGSIDALAELDQDGLILFANQVFDDMFRPGEDQSPDTLAGLPLPEPCRGDLLRAFDIAVAREREESVRTRTLTGRDQRYLECRIIPYAGDDERRVLLEVRDTTESRMMKSSLRAKQLNRYQEEYLKERRRRLFFGILDNFPTFVYMQRRDHTVAYANNKVRELYGETGNRRCYEVFAGRSEPCPVCPTFNVFKTGRPSEWEFTDNNGRSFLIYDYPYEDDNGEPLVMELGIDVTDLKRVEKELFLAQKLRAIGVLAGGIAHDLNNNLVPIIFNIEYALNKLNEQRLVEPLSEALQAAQRAGALVRQVLEYSRQQDVSRSSIRLTPLVRESLFEIRPTFPASVTVEFEQKAPQDSVFANEAQIQQLLQNLLANAVQSMPEGGEITVTVRGENVSADPVSGRRDLAPGQYVVLTVADSGVGIRPENLDRIFEPFFTSRRAIGGSGMGLAVVHSIVVGCGGSICVDSVPGIGTSFHIYFPRIAESTEPLQGELCRIRVADIVVLMVDDDPGALSAMARSLGEAGFTVETARSGEEGATVFARQPERYGLVLADHSMPGLTGLEMAKNMLAVDPDARIVICTGHIDPHLEEQARREGISGFARKPITPNDLIETVRQFSRMH